MKFFWCIHTVENCHSSTQPKYIFRKGCILKFPFTFKSYQIIIEFEWISSVHILIYTFSHWNTKVQILMDEEDQHKSQLKMKIINLSWMISGWFSILCPIHKDTKIIFFFFFSSNIIYQSEICITFN